jgi:TM2 domain-containing membrane protein YozV
MFPDIPFLIVFSLLGLFIFGIASMFIRRTMKNFQEMTAAFTTDTEQLAAAVALTRATQKSNRFVAVACAIICAFAGIGGLIVGSYEYSDTKAFLDKSEKAEGRVVRVELLSTESGVGVQKRSSISYYPRFTFQTHAGEIIEMTSLVGVPNASYYSPGEIIDVFYDPSNPHDAKLSTFFQLWAGTLLFFAVGVAFLIFPLGYGVYQFLGIRRRDVQSANFSV